MPRIPVESLVSPRQDEVQLQPGVFQQTAQATANLLSAVDGAGQMVKAQFDRAQDIHNQATISDKRLKIRNAQGKFQNDIIGDPNDPTKNPIPPHLWAEEWGNRLKALEGDLKLNDEPPAVSRVVENDFKNFSGTSLIEITGAALKENVKRARQNGERDLQYYRSTGNTEMANQTLDELHKRGIIDKDVYEDGGRTNDLIDQEKELRKDREFDARGYKKALENGEYPELTEVQTMDEIKKAETEIKVQENEALDMIWMQTGNFGPIQSVEDFERELDEAGDTISKNVKRRALNSFRNSVPLSPEEKTELQKEMDSLIKARENPSTYKDAYEGFKTKLSSYGKRDGTQDYYRDLNNYHIPSMHDESAVARKSEKQKADEIKKTGVLYRGFVSEAVDAIVESFDINRENGGWSDKIFALDEMVKPEDRIPLTKEEKTHNARVRGKEKKVF